MLGSVPKNKQRKWYNAKRCLNILRGHEWVGTCHGSNPYAVIEASGWQTVACRSSDQMYDYDWYTKWSCSRNKDGHLLLTIMESPSTIDDDNGTRWLFRYQNHDCNIERDMKLWRWKKWLVWRKGWGNKYGMECRWYVGVLPGCYYGTIACRDGITYVSKHHSETTGGKGVRWRYWSKLAHFHT